mgnify:CR=1 FL=1
MANITSSLSIPNSTTTAEIRQIVLNDISAKWGKLSEQDLSALKSKDDTKDIPVIFLSAKAQQGDIDKGTSGAMAAARWA